MDNNLQFFINLPYLGIMIIRHLFNLMIKLIMNKTIFAAVYQMNFINE